MFCSVPEKKLQSNKRKRTVEFALLKCLDDDDQNLKWDSTLANGIITVDEEANEDTIRKVIKESVNSKYPLIHKHDFEFVKGRQRKISRLQLGPGTEYDYAVVKKMAGQGILYVKVKDGYECLYEYDDANDSDEPFMKLSNELSSNDCSTENQFMVKETKDAITDKVSHDCHTEKQSLIMEANNTISDDQSPFDITVCKPEDEATDMHPYH